MTRLDFGPRLDIIGKDEAPDPEDSEFSREVTNYLEEQVYHDDIAELFGQVYTEESDDMIPPEGVLDFNQ